MTAGRFSGDGGHNPFSTRHVRPGAIPYAFLHEADQDTLLDQLAANQGWAEIVGPHGSGKSTLVHTLIPALTARGWRVVLFVLQRGQFSLRSKTECRSAWDGRAQWDAQTQVIVDGFEQLSSWNAWRLRRSCRRTGAGLLVTSHRPVGLPTLRNTSTSLMLAQQLVDFLGQHGPTPISPADVEASFARQQGNLREVFFELYDLHEQHRA